MTPEEWCRYYSLLSAGMSNDDEFELMMRYGRSVFLVDVWRLHCYLPTVLKVKMLQFPR